MLRYLSILLFAGAVALPAFGAEGKGDDALPELPGRTAFRRGGSAPGVDGVIRLSDGKAIGGKVSMTRDKRLELYDTTRKKWIRTTIKQVRLLEFSVEQEKIEKEWRWKASGRDDKVYSGRTYVDRRYRAALTVKRGAKKYAGHVLGTVVYVTDEKGTRHRYLLRKDHRGKVGQKPGQIVYVKQIDLRPGALEAFRKEQQKKRSRARAAKSDADTEKTPPESRQARPPAQESKPSDGK